MRSLDAKSTSKHSAVSRRTVVQLSKESVANKDAFLHNAAYWGLSNLVRCALEAKISANARSTGAYTTPVLVAAAGKGHASIVKQLLDAGADHSLTDSNEFTALNMAAQEDRLDCIQLLLAAGADANKAHMLGVSPLVTGIINKRGCVRTLLPVSDLLRTDKGGANALHACVLTGNEECFEMLLPLMSDVDARTQPGFDAETGQARTFFNQSALHHACQKGQQEMAKALLKCGADRMARDSLQKTPAFFAAQGGHLSCLTLLIGQPGRRKMTPADVDAVDEEGLTALHHAAERGHDKICGFLLEAGARLDAKTPEGHTPLMFAQQNRPTNTALHALLSGAGPAHPPGTVCDHCGKTAAQASVNSLKACSECHAVRYCGAECGAAAWKGHKKACRARAKEREEMAKPTWISV